MGTPEQSRPAGAAAPIELIDYGTREAWLAARSQGVGASESAALFGVSPWETPVSLWAKKTGRVVDKGPDGEWVLWGNLLEPAIATRYEQQTGRKIWQGGPYAVAQHPTIACMRATPDRWVIEAPDRRNVPGLLQVKNTNAFKVRDWDDGPPIWIQIQVQHEMAVTGLSWASVAVLIGGNEFQFFDVERHPAFIAELETQCQAFWRFVEADEQPPIDVSERTLETVKRLHPADNGSEIALPEQALEWWVQLEAAKANLKSAAADKLEAEVRLKDAIGDAVCGVLPDGRRLTLKTSHNPGSTSVTAPYDYRTLRMEKEWVPKQRRRR
jgi:putative phage-type endonuclease